MIFNTHSDLEGRHAILGASKPYWLNYDDEKMAAMIDKEMDAAKGTRLHALAAMLIKEGVKLPDTTQTLNLYVNDCIGFRMEVERILYYSPFAFGTADAIAFRDRVLQIFDLKNGKIMAKEEQLEIYAALFCLEYRVKPGEIEYDLRFYQHDQIYYVETSADRIAHIMERYEYANRLLMARREEMFA